MPRIYKIIVLALMPLWLIGCQTTSPQPAAVAVTTVTILPEALVVAPPAPISETPVPSSGVAPSSLPPPQIGHAGADAGAPRWPTNWNNVWIPLETWGRYNGVPKLTQHGS